MKNDRYLKIILTIIALCLVWICVRDIKIGPKKLYAGGSGSGEQEVYVTGGQLDVNITDIDSTAFYYAEPISVEVVNLPSVPQPEDK